LFYSGGFAPISAPTEWDRRNRGDDDGPALQISGSSVFFQRRGAARKTISAKRLTKTRSRYFAELFTPRRNPEGAPAPPYFPGSIMPSQLTSAVFFV
jgi:hypothetical protein